MPLLVEDGIKHLVFGVLILAPIGCNPTTHDRPHSPISKQRHFQWPKSAGFGLRLSKKLSWTRSALAQLHDMKKKSESNIDNSEADVADKCKYHNVVSKT